MTIALVRSTVTAFQYLNALYLTEAELLAVEGVGPEESEPVELPVPLPETVFICGDGVYLDAMPAMVALHEAENADRTIRAQDRREGLAYLSNLLPRASLVTLALKEEGRYEPAGFALQAAA